MRIHKWIGTRIVGHRPGSVSSSSLGPGSRLAEDKCPIKAVGANLRGAWQTVI